MKAADIKTLDDLEDWLKGQPIEVSVWIAYRAAARVLPIYWQGATIETRFRIVDLTAVPVLRAILISGERSLSAAPDILAAAAAADDDFNPAGLSIASTYARSAAICSAAAAANDDPARAASIATAATDNARSAEASAENDVAATYFALADIGAALDAVHKGQNGTALDLALWLDGIPPKMAEIWSGTRSRIPMPDPSHGDETARGPGREVADYWSFWVPWYQGLLDGKEIFSPALRREVALVSHDDPDEWAKGDVHINNVIIPRLMRKYAIPAAQRGERIQRTGAGHFFAEPVTSLGNEALTDSLDRIADGIAEFRERAETSNSLSVLREEVDRIEAAVEARKDRPLRLYEKLADTALTFLTKAAENGLENDPAVTILLRELERSRRDLRAGDDQIEQRIKARVRVGYDELTETQQEVWRGAIASGAESSEPGLRSEIEEDLPVIEDADQPTEIRERAIEREAERTIQMREHIVEGAEDVTKLGKAFGAATQVLNQIMGWFT